MIKLIGVLIVISGFMLKIETLFTVVVAGIATGLVAGLSLNEILTIIGESFVSNRMVSIFMLTLPAISILERYGLKQRAVHLIKRIGKLTTGRLFTVYTLIRQIAGALSIRMGGHPQFVRPLVNPMGQAAAVSATGAEKLEEDDEEQVKALAAASENYGNFYGQNLFAGSPGVLLIASTLTALGYEAETVDIAMAGFIVAGMAIVVVAIQGYLLDKKLSTKYKNKKK